MLEIRKRNNERGNLNEKNGKGCVESGKQKRRGKK